MLKGKDEGVDLEGRSLPDRRFCDPGPSRTGAGFLEAVYREALELQLKDDGVPFDSHPRLRLRYRQWTLKKGYQADFVCFGNIIVEIKAESRLTPIDQAQLINYLKATRLRTGVLINFGSVTKLEWKRFVY